MSCTNGKLMNMFDKYIKYFKFTLINNRLQRVTDNKEITRYSCEHSKNKKIYDIKSVRTLQIKFYFHVYYSYMFVNFLANNRYFIYMYIYIWNVPILCNIAILAILYIYKYIENIIWAVVLLHTILMHLRFE